MSLGDSPRAPAWLVWSRALVLAAVVLLVGSVSHVAAGGLLPHPGLMLILWLATSALATAHLVRPASTIRVVLLVVGGQSVIHLGLSALAGHRGSPPVLGGPSPGTLSGEGVASALTQAQTHLHAGGQLHDHLAESPVSTLGSGWLGHLVADMAEQGLLMLALHTIGAVAVALWLAVGESSLWALLALAAARLLRAGLELAVAALRTAGAALVLVARPAVRTVPDLRVRPRRPPTLSVLSSRGPPLLAG